MAVEGKITSETNQRPNFEFLTVGFVCILMGFGGLVSEFHLPEPNLFIAEDTSVIATEEETEAPKHPLKIRSDEVRRLCLKGQCHQ